MILYVEKCKRLKGECGIEMNKKYLILFGAGKNGISALEKYGKDKVAFFCDNALEKQGSEIEGITVISFEEMLNLYQHKYVIMVTPADCAYMIGQLELEGVYDYLVFQEDKTRFPMQNSDYDKERFSHENDILRDLSQQSEKLDLIKDISEFAVLSAEVLDKSKGKNVLLSYYGDGGEGNYYGNVQAIMKYAQIPEKDLRYFPIVSHAGCMQLFTTAFLYKSAVVMPGAYYKQKIHERAPYVPVFSIGPYIHYVEGIYDADKVKREKAKNGKTLLIFLPHTIEYVERPYDRRQFIDEILREYGEEFQSIWCCAYWADVNHPVCEYAESMGIHVVTAGFRFDSNFDRRLKTIIEMADAVVVGDVGTFIAYALYMGKPVARVEISDNATINDRQCRSELERKLQMVDEYAFENSFRQIFTEELRNTVEQKKWMNSVTGFDQIKDKEYIWNIYEISKDIWMQCEGDLLRYPEAVRQIYFKYDKSLEFRKMAILRDAVGAYVD